MIKIKAVIFDMDGVLIDSMDDHVKSWICALSECGIFPSEEDVFLLEGMSCYEMIEFLSQKNNLELTAEEKEKIYTLKKEKMAEIFQPKIYPQVETLLKFFKEKGLKLALVSGSHREFVNEMVERFFNGIFDAVVSGSDVKKGKPNPEPYLKALEDLGCSAGEALVVENAPLGIESAKKAGIVTYAIESTLDKKFLQSADRIFFSHEDLIGFLEEENLV